MYNCRIISAHLIAASLMLIAPGQSRASDCTPHWDLSSGKVDEHASLSRRVTSLAVYDDGSGPALYAGGYFQDVDGQHTPCFAKWDGVQWHPLVPSIDMVHGINALTVFDDGSSNGPALYAGGHFPYGPGMGAAEIATWDGSAFVPLTVSPDGAVHSFATFDDGSGSALYVGGRFDMVGDQAIKSIAKWDGKQWSPMGNTLDGTIFDIAVYDDGAGPALYVVGLHVLGDPPQGIVAKWDGSQWSQVGDGFDYGTMRALAVYDDGSGDGPALYVGGGFTASGKQKVSNIAKWDGSQWVPLGEGLGDVGGFSGEVMSMTVFDDQTGSGPALYVGGRFLDAGGSPANRIARWDGIQWSALGHGLMNAPYPPAAVYTMAAFDDGHGPAPALYVGGNFAGSGCLSGRHLARWGCTDQGPPIGDLDVNGCVDVSDLLTLLTAWGPCPRGACSADFNADGVVDASDLLLLLANWG